MINLFELLAKQFASGATKDIGRSVDAVASGDIKKIAGAAYDTFAPLPVQAALYSPEAEAAFIGPKGMARLKGTEFEKLMKPFISRFFGQRAELNPTDSDLVIQAMLGGPHATAKAKLAEQKAWREIILDRNHKEILKKVKTTPLSAEIYKQDIAKIMAEKPKELVAADFLEQFPALVAAYPDLKRVPVEVKQGYAGNEMAKFNPAHTPPTTTSIPPNVMDAVFKDMPITERLKRGPKLMEAYFKDMKKRNQVGRITVSLPDQAIGDYPGLTSYESILHEIQHFIQKQESGLTARDFLTDYKSRDNKLRSDIVTAAERKATDSRGYTDVHKLNWGQGLKVHSYDNDVSIPDEYLYKMNPFEREAFEASKRDITPAYRDAYSRITELIKKEVNK